MKVKSVKKVKCLQDDLVTELFVDEGFLLEGNAGLPDIDTDYASDGKGKIKELLKEKYNADGTENCFSAGTFTSMKIKASIKDVGRTFGISPALTNYMTAMIKDDGLSFTGFFKACVANKKLYRFAQDHPEVIEGIRTIMDQPKATSIHASAFIITPKHKRGKRVECFDYLPIRYMDGQLVSEYDGYSVDELGLLKLDLLSTKELMKIRNTINLVNENYGDRVAEIMDGIGFKSDKITMETIHTHLTEDPKTFQLFCNGHTQNIFQFSGYGMTKFVSEMQPNCVNDIIAANALYRPATIDIGAHDDYVKYKRGEAEPIYDWGTHEVLKNTYGLIVLQEQVMNLAKVVGEFKLADAAVLMKLVSKKKMDKLKKMKDQFMEGAKRQGCPDADANNIWRKIEAAGSYLFNLSHAASYGLTSYDGAWLKANFPTAFYTVALQFCDDDNIKSLMGEMTQTSNCKIVPPDINKSKLEFFTDFDTDEIFWSLSRIKFVGLKAVLVVMDERSDFGDFTSFKDFYVRVSARCEKYKAEAKSKGEKFTNPVNIRTMKNMILAGCFDKVNKIQTIPERFILVEQLFKLNGYSEVPKEEFPSNMIGKHYFWSMQQIAISGFGSIDYRRIYNASEAKPKIKKVSYLTVDEAMNQENEGRRCVVCATVVDVSERSGKTKAGDPYIFGKLQLQQNNQIIEYSLWNDTWKKRRPEVINAKGKMAVVTGVLKYSTFSQSNAMSGGSKAIIEII